MILDASKHKARAGQTVAQITKIVSYVFDVGEAYIDYEQNPAGVVGMMFDMPGPVLKVLHLLCSPISPPVESGLL